GDWSACAMTPPVASPVAARTTAPARCRLLTSFTSVFSFALPDYGRARYGVSEDSVASTSLRYVPGALPRIFWLRLTVTAWRVIGRAQCVSSGSTAADSGWNAAVPTRACSGSFSFLDPLDM